MPITQDRLISIVRAGLDYQQALKRAAEFTLERMQLVRTQQMTSDEAIEELATLITEIGLLKQPIESATILVTEQQYYKTSKSGNARRKEKARKERRAAGIKPRQTARQAIIGADPLDGATIADDLVIALRSGKSPTSIEFSGLKDDTQNEINAYIAAEEKAEEFIREQAEYGKKPKLRDNGTPNERTTEELDGELDDLMSGGIDGTGDET